MAHTIHVFSCDPKNYTHCTVKVEWQWSKQRTFIRARWICMHVMCIHTHISVCRPLINRNESKAWWRLCATQVLCAFLKDIIVKIGHKMKELVHASRESCKFIVTHDLHELQGLEAARLSMCLMGKRISVPLKLGSYEALSPSNNSYVPP